MRRTYVVQAGDSPAGIASRDEHAGCPKCCIDLTRCNRHKPTVTHDNGFVTFRELHVGETIFLPDKWFGPRLDLLPPAYYGCLPYADGRTPSPFGKMAPVVLRDFFAIDEADELLQDGENEKATALIKEAMLHTARGPAAVHGMHALRFIKQNDLLSAILAAQYALREKYRTLQPPEKHR